MLDGIPSAADAKAMIDAKSLEDIKDPKYCSSFEDAIKRAINTMIETRSYACCVAVNKSYYLTDECHDILNALSASLGYHTNCKLGLLENAFIYDNDNMKSHHYPSDYISFRIYY